MYDVIVVGGGHAGIEAAVACSKLNKKTALITGSLSRVGFLSCNPAIGGSVKGIVVREIDALGGVMAKAADLTQLQMKMLNRSKGPATWSLRAQVDKEKYPLVILDILKQQPNLTLIEGLVDDLIINDNKVVGIELQTKEKISAKAVIISTGTYLASNILIGLDILKEAADKQPTTRGISQKLKELGFKLIRLKTSTPPRISKDSVDFSKLEIQEGDKEFLTFSYNSPLLTKPQQDVCYITRTNPKTHKIINDNLNKTVMYSGISEVSGPRYCPAIEDKIVNFADKNHHQVFLEPETKNNQSIYLQGLYSALPKSAQVEMLHSIEGLENAEIISYAYAIEYDAIDPTQLKQTLETTMIENLFCAGQINGTSGYEEAACQGLIAGINASLKIDNKPPFILKRDEAYIGVLIDDLISKGTDEPYRLLLGRAEYRMLLRDDNADLRLSDYANNLGLLTKSDFERFNLKKTAIKEVFEFVTTTYLYPNKTINEILEENAFPTIKNKQSIYDLLKRTDIDYNIIKLFAEKEYSEEVMKHVEIEIKYSYYIAKAKAEAIKEKQFENYTIPTNIDYDLIKNLAEEAREKLKKHQPKTLGQAKRISGVNPTDVSVLSLYIRTTK